MRISGVFIRNSFLVVITTDDWHATNDLRQQPGASYPFLYDEKKRVHDDLDILEYTDSQHEPMIPTRSCSVRD